MADKKTTKNFAEVIRAEIDADPELAQELERERLHSDIAEQIIRLRSEADMTQKDLAEKVGSKQSVISRIEDADYYGHSLSMLERVAEVFNKRLFVVFCTHGYTPKVYGRDAAANATNTTASTIIYSSFVATEVAPVIGLGSDHYRIPEHFQGFSIPQTGMSVYRKCSEIGGLLSSGGK